MAEKVVLGLSGGVDSAVAAARLREMGFDVHGLFLEVGLGGEEQAARERQARCRYFLRWVVCAVAVGLEVAAVSLLKGVPLWAYLFAAAGSGPVLAVGLGLGFSLAVGLAFPQRVVAEIRQAAYHEALFKIVQRQDFFICHVAAPP